MKDYETIIIGGGFSGLIAAERISEKYPGGVAVIERNDRVGKKILSTGNGRGNFTNEEVSYKNYHSVKDNKAAFAIEKYGNKSIIDYFSSLGVYSASENGRVYPSSFQASSLLDALRNKLGFSGAAEITGERCIEIKKSGNNFVVKTDKAEYRAKKVVLSCGGKSQKQYGTDGTAYSLACAFGHKITETYPSLVQIKTAIEPIRGLKGLKQNVAASVTYNGKTLAKTVGDVLFTEYGVSGNTAFFLSSYAVGLSGAELKIEFLPDKSEGEIAEFLKKKSALPFVAAQDALSGVINKQIGRAVLKYANITEFNERTAEKIAKALKNFVLPIAGTLGFDYSQVTRGGVEFSGVDERTFESKYCKGLYIIGEMLDVDGDCGGYNLQWAYSSARSAADDIVCG